MTAYLTVAIACAIVGYVIGVGKGLGSTGVVLGAMFGPIGLIIVAVMKPAPGHRRPEPLTPAGWYADPWRQHRTRYWNGSGWTQSVAD